MNCRQAWNLIMKHYDNDSTPSERENLSVHLKKCRVCKEKFETLNEAFSVMENLNVKAPSDIEKKVMARLDTVKHERDFLIPYVVLNLIIFISIIIYWLEKIFKTGIVSFISELYKGMLVAYNTSTAVLTTIRSFWDIFLLRQAIIIIVVTGSITGVLSILSVIQKTRKRRYSEAEIQEGQR